MAPCTIEAPNAADLLTTEEASAALAVTSKTLANWRAKREGPAFLKIGKRAVRYRRADLEAFTRRVEAVA
ncbi:MAG: DNA-binding protein [Rhodanobacteraceae bacterium]|nr:MAG: DNA-binding protein [Rhodanobacteraceae bacterium]